jgi:hypothetical protein
LRFDGYKAAIVVGLFEKAIAVEFDALLLSRMQFAFTIAFHILFPAFTIGLAAFLAVLEGLCSGPSARPSKPCICSG